MLLDEVNWDELLNRDVDHMWTAWEAEFMNIMYQCIPTANPSAKSIVPQLHKGLTKAMRARNLAIRHMKRTRRLDHMLVYKRKRNKVVKKAKSKFFKKLNLRVFERLQNILQRNLLRFLSIRTVMEIQSKTTKKKLRFLMTSFPSDLTARTLP